MDTQMLIGGKFEAGSETEEKILNPKTARASLISRKPRSPRSKPPSTLPKPHSPLVADHAGQRSAYLLAIADAIEKDAAAFAALESLNCGKPINAVLNDEIPAVVDCYRFFAGAIRTLQAPVSGEYLPGFTSMIRRDAVGVIGSIAPWNYPLMMMAWKLAPALAGGNTGRLQAVGTDAADGAEACQGHGRHPAGRRDQRRARPWRKCRQCAHQHPKISMVSITGDIATGKKVLTAAAKTVKRTHLELGGKAPVIIHDDADIDAAVAAIRTFGYYNAGQDCTAACRIYASDKIYDRFVAILPAPYRPSNSIRPTMPRTRSAR